MMMIHDISVESSDLAMIFAQRNGIDIVAVMQYPLSR
jgi:hypothetical protein